MKSLQRLNIVTLNARGLRDKSKRLALWHALKTENVHVCFLQETFFTPDLKETINNEWAGAATCIHSWGTQHSRGVTCIIMDNNGIEVESKFTDPEGRLVLLNMYINNLTYTIVNIYAPNIEKDRNMFYKKVNKLVEQYGEDKTHCLIG